MDNTTLNAGAGGDVIATDDIGGVKYQRVKVTFGADGAAQDVDVAHGLPVNLVAALPAGSNSIGTVVSGGSGKTLKSKDFSLTATGTVIAAVATKRLKVYAIKLVPSAACTVAFRDGGATALEGAQSLAANGGYVESVPPPAWLLATSAGNALDLVITGTATVAGRVSYWDDDTT